MQLLELSLQGISGFPSPCRLPLGPGHVVVHGGAPLAPVLEALLYHDGTPDDAGQRLAAPGSSSSRIALTFQGRDGATWRLVRDLRGGSALQRLDAGAGFQTVTTSMPEIRPYLGAQVGLPSRGVFTELLTLSPERFPSRQPIDFPDSPAEAPRAAEVPLPAEIAPAPQASSRSIEEVEAQLRAARRSESLQRNHDRLSAEAASLDVLLGEVPRARSHLERARAGLAAWDHLASIPADFGKQLEAGAEADARRAEALRRIEEESESLESRVQAEPPPPLHRDWRFWLSLGAGVLLLGAALATRYKILALLDVPAFGAAAVFALRWLSDLQLREGVNRRRQRLDERHAAVRASWESETAEVRRALEVADVKDVAALTERLEDRERARASVVEAEAALAAVEQLPEIRAATERMVLLRQQLAAAEDELVAASAGAWSSVAELERELAELRGQAPAELARTGTGGRTSFPVAARVVGRADTPTAGLQRPRPALGRVPTSSDPCARLLDKAAELAAVERTELATRLTPRLAQYLAFLTDRRYAGVGFSASGSLKVVASGGPVDFERLPDAEKDMAWLALLLTAVEAHAARFPVPLILDEPFAGLPAARQAQVAGLLRGLPAQVIHRTALPVMAAAGVRVAEAR